MSLTYQLGVFSLVSLTPCSHIAAAYTVIRFSSDVNKDGRHWLLRRTAAMC